MQSNFPCSTDHRLLPHRFVGAGLSDHEVASTSAKLYLTRAISASASKHNGHNFFQRLSTTNFQASSGTTQTRVANNQRSDLLTVNRPLTVFPDVLASLGPDISTKSKERKVPTPSRERHLSRRFQLTHLAQGIPKRRVSPHRAAPDAREDADCVPAKASSCPHCGLFLTIKRDKTGTLLSFNAKEWRRLCKYPDLDSPVLCLAEGGSRSNT